MFIELHMLQNFAPSNLNRDDTGSPKDCEFGGVRRARVSSQCLKRSMRKLFRENHLLEEKNLAYRTRLLVGKVAEGIVGLDKGKDAEKAAAVVQVALKGAKLQTDEDGKTQYLLFLGSQEIQKLAELCLKHWSALEPLAAGEDSGDEKADKKKKKKEDKAAVPDEVAKEVDRILDGKTAADLALFGRMLADMPGKNVDAACQVAHAISTHKVSMEFDYYTAVDDLQPKEDSGAGMVGTIEFNSACFYRYAVVNLEQLVENLDGDKELALKSLEAFLHAAVAAIPTGKQNTFAAHNRPDFVLAVVTPDGAPMNLANAFEKAVATGREGGFVPRSIEALDQYYKKLTGAYGNGGGKLFAVQVTAEPKKLDGLGVEPRSFADLVKGVLDAVKA
jgi:CRISPR system Cascade subunit CasC